MLPPSVYFIYIIISRSEKGVKHYGENEVLAIAENL